MSDNEKRLAQSLVGLYKTVRLQQEAISRLMMHSEAVNDTLSSLSPAAAAELNRNLGKASASGTAQALRASLELIDSTIASLQSTFGPWNN